jgi:hypothetical protein
MVGREHSPVRMKRSIRHRRRAAGLLSWIVGVRYHLPRLLAEAKNQYIAIVFSNTNGRVFRSADDPNEVVVLQDAADVAKARWP